MKIESSIIHLTIKIKIMKNLKINFNIFVVALVTLFSVSFTTAATAADGTTNLPVNLKYLGVANNAPIFQLSFTNEKAEAFEVTITDKYNTIYTEVVKGKASVRRYQFVSNEANVVAGEDEEIVVSIKNIASNNVVVYKLHPGSPVEAEKELVAFK